MTPFPLLTLTLSYLPIFFSAFEPGICQGQLSRLIVSTSLNLNNLTYAVRYAINKKINIITFFNLS